MSHSFGPLVLYVPGPIVGTGLPGDAFGCGFPSVGAQMRAIGIALSHLPEEAEVSLVPREFGKTPMILLPDPPRPPRK